LILIKFRVKLSSLFKKALQPYEVLFLFLNDLDANSYIFQKLCNLPLQI